MIQTHISMRCGPDSSKARRISRARSSAGEIPAVGSLFFAKRGIGYGRTGSM